MDAFRLRCLLARSNQAKLGLTISVPEGVLVAPLDLGSGELEENSSSEGTPKFPLITILEYEWVDGEVAMYKLTYTMTETCMLFKNANHVCLFEDSKDIHFNTRAFQSEEEPNLT
ncbi:hypothetical protein VNO78_16298 [Psophocarpus tetragonolobus]|uniref:Uncharacterized protein n=1 Tax=Psophocarpus tetragonolobus TaxID=3891 RepID=A0AAN9SG13_PSOTE